MFFSEKFYDHENPKRSSYVLKFLILSLTIVSLYLYKELKRIRQIYEDAESRRVLICHTKQDISQGETIRTEHFQRRSIHDSCASFPNTYFWKDRDTLLGKVATMDIKAGTHFNHTHFQNIPPVIVPQIGEGVLDTEKLIKNLESTDPHKRKESARILGQIGKSLKATLPILLSLINDPDPEVQETVHKALKYISGIE
jgi:hypothetical protein